MFNAPSQTQNDSAEPPAAHREAHQGKVLRAGLLNDRCEVVSQGIVVIPRPGLG